MTEAAQLTEILYERKSELEQFYAGSKEGILESLRELLLTNPGEYDRELRRKAYLVFLHLAESSWIDVRERWGIYLDLIYITFVSTDYDLYDAQFRNAYGMIESHVESAVATCRVNDPILREAVPSNPVVIVTSQFLSESHAPTRRVLDYAYTIETTLQMPVVIINDAGMHGDGNRVNYNFIEQYNTVQRYEYRGLSFPFYQSAVNTPDMEELARIVRWVREMKPRIVFNVGGYSMLTDICRGFTRTASIPCAIDYAVSLAEYMILPRTKRDADREVTATFRPWQKTVISRYNYVYSTGDGQTYSRGEFQLGDDQFIVAIIGNRLDTEMTDGFLHMLRKVLESSERISVLFIGEVKRQDRILRQIEHEEQIRFAGSVSNGGACLSITDLYIQPTRSGGGRSAFEALWQGIPVISTRYGDVWGTVGEDFCVNDYDEMKNAIEKYESEGSYYDTQQQKARERAAILEDMPGTFRALFADMGIR